MPTNPVPGLEGVRPGGPAHSLPLPGKQEIRTLPALTLDRCVILEKPSASLGPQLPQNLEGFSRDPLEGSCFLPSPPLTKG